MKKYSLRYWVKQQDSWNWRDVFSEATETFAAHGEHPEIDFAGDLVAFANELHNERYRRGKPYNCAYFTPPDVAEWMALSIGCGSGRLVIDPCCGVGNLLQAAVKYGDTVAGMEYQPELAGVCRLVGYAVETGDWLERDGLPTPDAVMINPPFGKMWAHADIAVPFMERVAEYGVPVAAILPNGWLDKPQKKYRAVRERYDILEAQELPLGTFALTNVATTRYLLRGLG